MGRLPNQPQTDSLRQFFCAGIASTQTRAQARANTQICNFLPAIRKYPERVEAIAMHEGGVNGIRFS